MEVKDIMVEPVCIDKSETLSHAMDIMEKNGLRRLLVLHNEEINGFITMRTIARALGTRKNAGLPASALHVASATSDNFTKVLPDMKLQDAITLINRNGGVLVVMDNNTLLGWVTPQEILENARGLEGTAEEAMTRDLITVNTLNRVSHARRLMLDNNIGRVPVVEQGHLVGILTEKDIAKAMRAFRDLVPRNQQDSRIKNLLVEDIMTRDVITVNKDTPLSEVTRIMLEENIGGVPVLNASEELEGIITRRSIIKVLADKQ